MTTETQGATASVPHAAHAGALSRQRPSGAGAAPQDFLSLLMAADLTDATGGLGLEAQTGETVIDGIDASSQKDEIDHPANGTSVDPALQGQGAEILSKQLPSGGSPAAQSGLSAQWSEIRGVGGSLPNGLNTNDQSGLASSKGQSGDPTSMVGINLAIQAAALNGEGATPSGDPSMDQQSLSQMVPAARVQGRSSGGSIEAEEKELELGEKAHRKTFGSTRTGALMAQQHATGMDLSVTKKLQNASIEQDRTTGKGMGGVPVEQARATVELDEVYRDITKIEQVSGTSPRAELVDLVGKSDASNTSGQQGEPNGDQHGAALSDLASAGSDNDAVSMEPKEAVQDGALLTMRRATVDLAGRNGEDLRIQVEVSGADTQLLFQGSDGNSLEVIAQSLDVLRSSLADDGLNLAQVDLGLIAPEAGAGGQTFEMGHGNGRSFEPSQPQQDEARRSAALAVSDGTSRERPAGATNRILDAYA